MPELSDPIFISARLLPAIKIADCTISVDCVGASPDNRLVFRCYFDRPGKRTFIDDNLRSGCAARYDSAKIRTTFASLISFLSAAVESRQYRERTGRTGENENLFPGFVVRFFDEHSAELDSLSCDFMDE